MKHTSWGNSRICVVEQQLPWVINIQGSGYVVALIGCWACSEAGCCGGNSLELNPAWSLCIVSSFLCSLRGGGSRFSHAPTHTLYVRLCTPLYVCACACVSSSAWFNNVVFTLSAFLSNCFQLRWESFSSFYIIQTYNDECIQAWLNFIYFSKCQASFSWHKLACTCLHHLTQNVSVIYHSGKVMHGHLLSPGNARLYL